MSASVPIPFPLHATLWWVGHGSRQEVIVCPECVGTKALTLILGNGESVTLECATCRRGYEPSTGVVTRTVFCHRPEQFIPHRVSVDGETVHYSEAYPEAGAYRSMEAKDLFESEVACQVRCDELNIERAAFAEERVVRNLASKRHDLAWSVHYWRRQVADLERNLEVARGHLAVCREKKATARTDALERS